MNKNKVKIFIYAIIIILSLIVFLIPTEAKAKNDFEIKLSKGIVNPDDYEPSDLTEGDTTVITTKASKITSTIGVIGIIVSVVTLILIGIKFMTGSIEEKAEYKKSMIPYLIGVFIFLTITQLLNIVVKIIEGTDI